MAYTFHNQRAFATYIEQFLRIFSGFQVEYNVDRNKDGQKDRKTCPVYHGDMSRIVANVLRTDGTFVSSSMPIMSGVVTAIEINPEDRRSSYHRESVTRLRESDNTRIVDTKLMGVPYRINMDLSIWTTNNTQMFQLLEQILLLFNPKLTIQTGDNIIDWSYLTEVELVAITSEQNLPAGVDERTLIYTLSFTFPVWLDFPSVQKTNIIKTIETNIRDNTNLSAGVDLENLVIDENTPL